MTNLSSPAFSSRRLEQNRWSSSPPTKTFNLVKPSGSAPTPVSAVAVTADAAKLVSDVRSLSDNVVDTHSEALSVELSIRTQKRVRESPKDSLGILGDKGFSWRGIARLLGVSVPAIQKWRRGEGVSGENRRKIAELLAGIDLISSQLTVQEIESWFETPISSDAPVTPLDLWSAGKQRLVLQYASGQLKTADVLDEFEPNWREKWRSNFTVFRGEDGQLSIAPKD